MHPPVTHSAPARRGHFELGAVIDTHGNEIPITEGMIQQALQTLLRQDAAAREQRQRPS